jgi:hypothetical protein
MRVSTRSNNLPTSARGGAEWAALKRHFHDGNWKPLAVVILLETLFALLLFRSRGTEDVSQYWMPWIDGILKNGLVDGYAAAGRDYPPFCSVILFLVAKTAAVCSIDIFLSFKVFLVIALLVATLCYWFWTPDGGLTGLLALSLSLNGVALGYLDSFFAPTLILSLWALQQKRIALFSGLFAISCLIKWQPLIIAPFLILHAVSIFTGDPMSARALVRRWIHLAAPALIILAVAVASFGFTPIADSFKHTVQHRLLSGDALNFNWLVTWFLQVFYPDTYGPVTDGIVQAVTIDRAAGWVNAIRLVFLLFYLGVLWRLLKIRRSFAGAIECALAGYLSYFMFNIGVHENHLFLAAVLAVVAAGLEPNWRLGAVLIVAISNFNLIAFYGFTGTPLPFPPVVGVDVSIIFSLVNLVLFLLFWGDLVLRARSASRHVSAGPHPV